VDIESLPSPTPRLAILSQAHRRTFWAALLLALFTLVVFWPAIRSEFTCYDDPDYVTHNPHVQAGLTWPGLSWAFGRLHGEQTYWHPLAWVSHMADCQLFGLNPVGHHLVNVLLHVLNTVLVFLVFGRMTGVFWRSLVLAALFALHPLQVDTVAWVAERKNLLSTLFWLLTMWAYVRYTDGGRMNGERGREPPASRLTRRAACYYVLALLFFALGLMCKPVLVTLPFVLLLLDYWPLERLQPSSLAQPVQPPSPLVPRLPLLWLRVAEKAPFILLAIASSVITIASHRALKGMMGAAAGLPLEPRVENAVVSYVRYLGKAVWPVRLAVFYPHPVSWPMGTVILCGLLLAGLSVLAVGSARQRPYLLVGWFWFLGVLVPFIGLLQAGAQAMADRFAYVPLLGLFLAVVWGAGDIAIHWRHRSFALAALATAACLACLALTRRQIEYWKNDETLFRHALAVTEDNDVAHVNLAFRLVNRGALDEAIGHYEAAIRLSPLDADTHSSLAYALARKRRLSEAAAEYEEALRLKPDDGELHNDLGITLAAEGRVDDAIAHYREALRLKADLPQVHYNLGSALMSRGAYAEAAAQFNEVLRVSPDVAAAHYQLGMACLKQQQIPAAVDHWRAAVRLKPQWPDLLNNLAWVLATDPHAELRNGAEAVRLALRAAELAGTNDLRVLDTLAAAYAETGRFAEAAGTMEHAMALAEARQTTNSLAEFRHRLDLYRKRTPYRAE